MLIKFLSSLVAVLMPMLFATAVSAQILITENHPPLSMVNSETGEISGMATELVRELMRRSDEKYSLHLYPWSRALLTARTKADTCVFSTSRTPGRESSFKWVGPLTGNDLVIFGRAGDTGHPTSLEDIRFKAIGTKANDSSTEFLLSWGYYVDAAALDRDNPRKLMHRRFDYWTASGSLGAELIRQEGLSNEIIPLFAFKHVDLYLACNRDMEQSKVDRWNRILKAMDKDGTILELKKKYQLFS